MENENFYLLTLVAMAKELEIRGKSEADVVLAVGLPLVKRHLSSMLAHGLLTVC